MIEPRSIFVKLVDDLVECADDDPDLTDGIRWIDAQAQKKGITFYDMVFEVLYKHDTNTRAQVWFRTRS